MPDGEASARRSRGKLLAVLGVVGLLAGVLLVAGVVLTLALWKPRQPRRVVVPEDPEQRRRELREAFADRKPALGEKEIAAELEAFFTELGAAYRAADAERLAGHYDVDRMYEELAAQHALPPQVRRDPKGFVRGLRQGLGQALQKQATVLAWKDFEIRKIKQLPDGEAVVTVRHQTPEGTTLKMRWWVTSRTGDWKVYDVEELTTCLRLTAEMGLALEGGVQSIPQRTRALQAIRAAFEALGKEDADTADRQLKGIAGIRLPRKLDGVRLLATACVHLQRQQFKEALAAVAKARAGHPDMPLLDFIQGAALNGLGEWAEALKHLAAYRDLLGEDEDICEKIGESLRGLRRFDEAAAAYRKALDHNPKQADSLLGLLHSLGPDDKRDDIPARFARLDQRRETFLAIAEALHENQDAVGLEQIVLAMRKLDPRFGPIDYYECLVRARAGKEAEAVRLFQSALAAEKDAKKRESYRTGFLQAMAKAGKAVAAYSVVTGPREAFALLAGELKQAYRFDELGRLADAHRKKDPGDPLLPFYQGEIHAWEQDYPLAEKAFAAGMVKPPEPAVLERFRAARVEARYHTGQALAAYKEIAPRRDTFAQLVALMLGDEEYGQLERLLDAHAKAEPGDPQTARHRCILKIRQGRSVEAVAPFQAALAKETKAEQREEMTAEFLEAMREAGQVLEGYEAVPDARLAFQKLAGDLSRSEQLPELRRLIEAHRKRQPDDPWLVFYTGELHLGEKAWEKAAQTFGQWWKKAPEEVRKGWRWKYVYALYMAGKWREAYDRAAPRNDTFFQLAHLLYADKKGAELDELVAAHRTHAGGDANLLYHEARAKLLLKQQAKACDLVGKAFRQQAVEQTRWQYLSWFVSAMQEAGQGLEGYRAAPDSAFAFRTLAGELVRRKKATDLERLLGEHGKSHPDDPYYRFYSGELNLLRGDAARADQDFTAARAKASRQQEWIFRNGLLRSRVLAGKTAETYREFGPGTDTFAELAGVCQQEKNAKELAALIAAHRKAQPDDANLLGWELELLWLNKDYAGALKLLNAHRTGLFTRPRWRWTGSDYLVRGLVRLKKSVEAVREAQAVVKGKRGDVVLLILAHAANGDVQQAVATLDKTRQARSLRQRCYQDEDLGPILRTEAFRAFREKYPEAKDADEED